MGALRHWNVSRRQKWAARIGCGVLAAPFLLGGIYVTVGWFGSVGWAFVSIVFVIISVYYFKSRSQEAGKQKQSRAGT